MEYLLGTGAGPGVIEPPRGIAGVSRSYPAVPGAVADARGDVCALAARAGAGPEQLDAIRLAVSEAATNAVRHAYRDAAGEVHVIATLADRVLTVVVSDDGCGPHEPAATPGLGWGLAVMADCAERFSLYARPSGGTEAVIRFRLA